MEAQRRVLVVALARAHPRRLHKELVLIELEIGTEQRLYHIEDFLIAGVGGEDLVAEGYMAHLAQRIGVIIGVLFPARYPRLHLQSCGRHMLGLAAGDPLGPRAQRGDLRLVEQTRDDEHTILAKAICVYRDIGHSPALANLSVTANVYHTAFFLWIRANSALT